MSLLDRLLGNDHQRAAKYQDRESATERAARKRREGHHRSIRTAADAGERWERADRARDRRGDRDTDWN